MSDNNHWPPATNPTYQFPSSDEITKLDPKEREERCNKWKQEGNDAFASKDYRLAVEKYTEALKYDARDYKVYSNRSYAYLLLGDPKKSASDAMFVLNLQPKWTKGYFRFGYAMCAMKQYLRALEAFAGGLELDPANHELQSAFRQTRELLGKQVYETITWAPRTILGSSGAKQRCGHTATMIGYNMYLVGGINQGLMSKVNVVNTDSMTQVTREPTGEVPEGRAVHTAVLWGNQIITFGGTSGERYFNDVYALNSDTFTWKKWECSGDIPSSRCSHTAVLFGSDMYVFGGVNQSQSFGDLFILDMKETKKWSRPRTKGNAPPARNSHCVCLVGMRMIIHGGCNGAENYFDDLWVLDLETLTWSQPEVTSSTPSPRIGHTANLLGNRMYIFGGMTKVNGEPAYTSDTWILDTENFSWHRPEHLGEIPKPRMGHSACQLGKKIYIFGGDAGNNILDDIAVGETDIDLQRVLSDFKEETVRMQEEMAKLKRKTN